MDHAYQEAMKEWCCLLKSENIVQDDVALESYRCSTLGQKYNTPLVLRPSTTLELSRCMEIAYKHKIKVFPISRGQNHGYNSAAPLTDDTIVIDLQLMDQILEYNEEFGYVIIEPGVTFSKLYQFLIAQKSDYMLSGFSGSSQASVMANALERGIGRGFYGNRALSTDIKEIILSDGNKINLRDRFSTPDLTTNFQHATVGLELGKLFYQSNLAIATKMILHLEPIPEYFMLASIKVPHDTALFTLMDKLHELLKLNIVTPVFPIVNDMRLLVGSGLYKKSNLRSVLDMDSLLKEFISKRDCDKWNVTLTFQGSCMEEIELKQKLLDYHLSHVKANIFCKHIQKLDAIKLMKNSLSQDFMPSAEDLQFLFNLGYTNEYDQKSLYWDIKPNFCLGKDPIREGCGLIFFTPKIPLKGVHFSKSLQLLESVAKQYEMEMPVTFQVKTREFACMILPILFDLKDLKSKEKATLYYETLLDQFTQHGYVSARLTSLSMENLSKENVTLSKLIGKLKSSFDPYHMICPKRYEL